MGFDFLRSIVGEPWASPSKSDVIVLAIPVSEPDLECVIFPSLLMRAAFFHYLAAFVKALLWAKPEFVMRLVYDL